MLVAFLGRYGGDMRANKLRKSLIFAVVVILATMIAAFTAVACSSNNGNIVYIYEGITEQEAPGVIVPDLRGSTREELTLEFQSLGLTPAFARLISDAPVDTVFFIERIGQRILAPATLHVHVSAGQPEFETVQLESEPAQMPQTFDRIEFGGISWLVLDEYENKVLLLSEYAILYGAYNDTMAAVTWEDSTIRHYLNNEFLYRFSSEEIAVIAETKVVNDDVLASQAGATWYVPGGNDTYDMVFLLSIEEAERFFESNFARMAVNLDGEQSWWWLRSPGTTNFSAANILGNNGMVNRGGASVHHSSVWFGIRPALWVRMPI